MVPVKPGDIVRNVLGHPFEVIEITTGGYRLFVQPMTMVGVSLMPIGGPCWIMRSDLKD